MFSENPPQAASTDAVVSRSVFIFVLGMRIHRKTFTSLSDHLEERSETVLEPRFPKRVKDL
jgi:hypothetical protein